MKLKELYEYVELKIGSAFAAYGAFASRHPVKIILVTILVNGLLGIGMMRLQSETDAANVFLPQGSQARKDQKRLEGVFPDLSATNYQSYQMSTLGAFASVLIRSKSGNLLNRASLDELTALNNLIQAITATNGDGSTIVFSDICARYQGACSVDGDVFWSSEFLTATDQNNVTYPTFTTATGTRNYVRYLGGNVQANTTHLQGMEYLSIEYRFRTDGDYEDIALKWCDVFLDVMEAYIGTNFDIKYAHFKSLDEELDKNVRGDIALFSITMTLMITYSCLATFSARGIEIEACSHDATKRENMIRMTDQVGQRMWLGFGGMAASGLAIVASFGFCAAIGVEFVSIVGVVPFLIVGIGIDDMFILLSGLSGAQNQLTIEGKIAETMRASGVGITITSLTDFIAFMSGIGSVFVAVKNFCIYTGVAVVFCYINNITLFCACMTIHEKRVEQNRHYATCLRVKRKEECVTEGRSNAYIMCCSGRPPTNRDEAESLLDRFPRWLIPKIVLKAPFKILILFLFAGYMAGAVYGCVNLRQGLKFTELVSGDSYFYAFSDWNEKYFVRQTPVSYIIDRTYSYSTSLTQSTLENFIARVKSDPYFDDTFEINWLTTYKSTPYYDDTSEAAFIAGLQTFLSQAEFNLFENDVIIDTTNNLITAARFHVISVDLEGSQEEGKMMLRARELADGASFDCYAFHPAFVAFEQFVAILGQTLQSVGIALAAVFVVTCLFMPHPLLVVLVTVAVTMIMVGVFGYIYYIDVALSSITMIHLIMSIGFSIDFTAHVCHGFMISDADSRAGRVRQSIDKTGAPIFHGAVSSIIGVVVLFAANSYIFRTFAVVMCFVLLFGITHALLLLPVILSWIGPGRLNMVSDDKAAASQPPSHLETSTNNDVDNNRYFDTENDKDLPNDTGRDKAEVTPTEDFRLKASTFKLEPRASPGQYDWTEKRD